MSAINIQEQIAPTLNGLGYNLVDFQVQPRYGMLRLFIERAPNYQSGKNFPETPQEENSTVNLQNPLYKKYPQILANRVSVEDCAFVSNHLTRVFMVENVDYQRLEVSSPGLNRKLSTPRELEFFSGMPIKLTIIHPLINKMNIAQKHFRGIFEYLTTTPPQINITDSGCVYNIALSDFESAKLDEDEILDFWSAKKSNSKNSSPKKLTNRKKEMVNES